MQHALRVDEGFIVDAQGSGVVIDDVSDTKAQRRTGVLVGAAPNLPRGRGSGAVRAAHTLGLDALTRIDVGGARLCKQRLPAGDYFAVDAAGDFERGVDSLAADALDDDVNDVVQLNHSVHGIGPAHHLPVAGREVLRGGRKPHAMNQRSLESHELGGVIRSVDGVVIARDQREWGHILRGSDYRAVDKGARGGGDLGRGFAAAPLRSRRRCRGAARAPTDGKALDLRSDDFARIFRDVGAVAQFELHGHDSPGGGFLDGGALGGDVDAAAVGQLGERNTQVHEVI